MCTNTDAKRRAIGRIINTLGKATIHDTNHELNQMDTMPCSNPMVFSVLIKDTIPLIINDKINGITIAI